MTKGIRPYALCQAAADPSSSSLLGSKACFPRDIESLRTVHVDVAVRAPAAAARGHHASAMPHKPPVIFLTPVPRMQSHRNLSTAENSVDSILRIKN